MKEITDKQASCDLLTDGMMGTGEVPALPGGGVRRGPHPCQEGTRGATRSRNWKPSLNLLELGSCQLGLPSTQHLCRSCLSIQSQGVPEGYFPPHSSQQTPLGCLL